MITNAKLKLDPSVYRKYADVIENAQKVLDAAVVRFNEPYCPWDNGTMAHTVRGLGTGLIEYTVPYAQYQYYGYVMVSPSGTDKSWLGETKVLTNKKLRYNGAPMRGARFFDRMVADRKEDLLEEVRRVIGK